MDQRHLPAFLAHGTFLPDELGYFFSGPAPVDLLAPSSLLHRDPWIVLAAVLELAKAGNFSEVARLETLIDPEGSSLLAGGIFELLGDIGTSDAVRILLAMMRHRCDPLKVQACQAARHVGVVWLVPSMLEAWDSLEGANDQDLVTLILSEMLEEERGPINQSKHSEVDLSPQEHHAVILSRARELEERLGKNVAVWAGQRFGVVTLARKMFDVLNSGEKSGFALYAAMLELRGRFEASTGVNCSCFFKNRQVQRLAASAIIEEFLDSEEPRKYEEGVRYFFGHPIPPPERSVLVKSC